MKGSGTEVGLSYGYDTVVLAVGQPEAVGRVLWGGESHSRGAHLVDRWWRNEELFQLTYVRRVDRATERTLVDELQLQCSLPRVLYGSNVETVTEDNEVGQAVVKAARLAAASAGVEADWWGGAVRRVDVTADASMGDEALVGAALGRLAHLAIGGRYPVRGESFSVSWPRKAGSFTRKAYSKFVESGDERARGRLRLEVGCNGQQSLKKALSASGGWTGVAAPTVVRARRSFAGSPVLTAAALVGESGDVLRRRVGGEFRALIAPCLKGVTDMEAWTVFSAFRVHHRSDVAIRLVGYAVLVQRLGWEGLALMVGRMTVWRVKKAFQLAGVDPFEVDFFDRGERPFLDEVARSSDAGQRRAGQLGLSLVGNEELAKGEG